MQYAHWGKLRRAGGVVSCLFIGRKGSGDSGTPEEAAFLQETACG